MEGFAFVFLGTGMVAIVLAVLGAVFFVGWMSGYQHKD